MKIKFSTPITSSEICFATGARYRGEKRSFTHLSTSSVDADENTIFFALDGKRTTGEEFVRELAMRNVCSVTKREEDTSFTHSAPLNALLRLASYYKGKLRALVKTIAITGSVGKTTTKEFLLRILSERWRAFANEGNYNSEIGVPLTVFTTPLDTEVLILEFGMNHRGEMERLAECVKPDLAIITNIGHAHIGNLGSREAIAEEKMKVAIHNPEMPVIIDANEPLLQLLRKKVALYKDFTFTEAECGQSELGYQEVRCRLILPRFSYDTLSCLHFAIATGIFLELDEATLQRGVDACALVPLRRREIKIGSFRVIDDTYNASPESMMSAISYLKDIKAKRKFIVLGDMLELGEHAAHLHNALGKSLCTAPPDAVFLLGELGGYTREGLIEGGYPPESIYWLSDARNHEGMIRILSDILKKGDVCLLKGSHASRLWRITEGLEEVFS